MPSLARVKPPRLAFRCPDFPQTPVSIQHHFWWVILLIGSKWHLLVAAGTAPCASLRPRWAHERLAQRSTQRAGYSFEKSRLTLPSAARDCLQPLLVQSTVCQLETLNGSNDVTKTLKLISNRQHWMAEPADWKIRTSIKKKCHLDPEILNCACTTILSCNISDDNFKVYNKQTNVPPLRSRSCTASI